MALTQLLRNGILGLTETDARILECIRCHGQFALSAVREGRYVIESMTCWVCYRELAARPPTQSCFGKLKGAGHEGYSEADVECQLHCEDKKPCVQYITQGASMAEKDELEDVDFSEDEKPVKKAKGAKKAPAKEGKAKKAKTEKAEPEPDPCPKEVGDRWPWKANSDMRYAFKLVFLAGGKMTTEEFTKAVKKEGMNEALLLRVLRKGRSGKSVITHKWKLDESGGRLKITDVQYLGPDGRTGATKTKKSEKSEAKGKKTETKAVAKTGGKKKAKKATA